MATLISPGSSVTVENTSFFIPAGGANATPLFFIATAEEKTNPAGDEAAGTYESNVIRAVSSLRQSTELYGIPRFIESTAGVPHYGDARNEVGLFGLNHFLGLGSLAYVVRANVNLNDDLAAIRVMWDNKLQQAGFMIESLASAIITDFNSTNGFIPTDPGYKTTITKTQLLSAAATALAPVWALFSFRNSSSSFVSSHTLTPLDVYANGYNVPATGEFLGLTGIADEWIAGSLGSTPSFETEWTPAEAQDTLIGAGDQFKFTTEFYYQTSLGSNDAARRTAIVTALQAAVNSNTDVRSETYEYNLIICPGYPELVDELVNLRTDISEEAFVVGDSPMNLTAEATQLWAQTSARVSNEGVAYYYPHGFASNLDGKNVAVPSSVIALRTYAFSDTVSGLYKAPAGTQRGVVTGMSMVGYVSGTIGTPNVSFVEVNLNKGQEGLLYNYPTNINPIVFQPGRGIIVNGQKTSAPVASTRDRVKAERLLGYIRRQLRKNTAPFIFEPNDQITRNNVKAAVDGFLGDVLAKRGLYDFATLCDESNNTPDRIDRSELYIDIALKIAKDVEFLYVPIRLVSTGAEI